MSEEQLKLETPMPYLYNEYQQHVEEETERHVSDQDGCDGDHNCVRVGNQLGGRRLRCGGSVVAQHDGI